jgi:hypothetical protein
MSEAPAKTQKALQILPVAGFTVAAGLAWTYALIVLFMDETVLGIEIRHRYLALAILVGFGCFCWLASTAARNHRVSLPTLNSITLATVASLCALIAADTAYKVYLNASSSPSNDLYLSAKRIMDPNIWVGELHPRDYFPTESNWHIFKPNTSISGTHYGWTYMPEMLKSPVLSKSVLERHHVSFSIDRHGFRETSDLHQARIFALGDSFTFGWGLDQADSWPKLLEKGLGQPVYNLGTHDASPKQEVELLGYLLKSQPDHVTIHELFWMIYEGNDLEDGYESLVVRKGATEDFLAGTILEPIASLPRTIKHQSIIHNLQTGRSVVRAIGRNAAAYDPFEVDGVKLVTPLYHSPKFGYRLFVPRHLKIVAESASYVQTHPNRPALDQAFADMAALAQKHRFHVTVLIMPTAERLYAPYFEHFPAISEQPHFIRYIEALSNRMGFETMSFETLMKPYSEKELLYFRDDDHLNRRGSEVVVEILMEHIRLRSMTSHVLPVGIEQPNRSVYPFYR